MLVVTEIKAVEMSLICPHCGKTQRGWVGDPRGGVHECDACNKEYKIHKEADIEMY